PKYEIWRALHGHTRSITVLRFSPDGKFLASGAMDSYVCIWSMRQGSVVQRIKNYASGPVTDIVWAVVPSKETVLIFSLADGTVHFYRPVDDHFEGTTILCAHSWAIEAIDYDPVHHRLATSAGNEIKVWDLTSTCNCHSCFP
ncbi:hypothetical protein M422DRAFT_195188, partial [Sphaerobolus stellatus SS14]